MCLFNRASQQGHSSIHLTCPAFSTWMANYSDKKSYLYFTTVWSILLTTGHKALLIISGELILRPSFPFSTFKPKNSSSLFHFCILFCSGKCSFTNLKLLDIAGSWLGKWRCFWFFSSLCLFIGMMQSWHLQALLSQKAIAAFIALLISSMSSAGSEKTAWSKAGQNSSQMKHSGLSLWTGCS